MNPNVKCKRVDQLLSCFRVHSEAISSKYKIDMEQEHDEIFLKMNLKTNFIKRLIVELYIKLINYKAVLS
jgi:hypothetical protein